MAVTGCSEAIDSTQHERWKWLLLPSPWTISTDQRWNHIQRGHRHLFPQMFHFGGDSANVLLEWQCEKRSLLWISLPQSSRLGRWPNLFSLGICSSVTFTLKEAIKVLPVCISEKNICLLSLRWAKQSTSESVTHNIRLSLKTNCT